MRSRTAIEVARNFLAVVWADVPPDDAQLERALDRLLAAFHDVHPAEGVDCDVVPPKEEWSDLYEQIRVRFPNLGHYTVASPLAVGEGSVLTGDPIDDLADLTSDLRQVVWRGDHFGADEAAWYFHLMYEVHWGRHARELALYLHARLTSSSE
jgi:hypothetical protein